MQYKAGTNCDNSISGPEGKDGALKHRFVTVSTSFVLHLYLKIKSLFSLKTSFSVVGKSQKWRIPAADFSQKNT